MVNVLWEGCTTPVNLPGLEMALLSREGPPVKGGYQ
jgi:hypothetical protein